MRVLFTRRHHTPPTPLSLCVGLVVLRVSFANATSRVYYVQVYDQEGSTQTLVEQTQQVQCNTYITPTQTQRERCTQGPCVCGCVTDSRRTCRI